MWAVRGQATDGQLYGGGSGRSGVKGPSGGLATGMRPRGVPRLRAGRASVSYTHLTLPTTPYV